MRKLVALVVVVLVVCVGWMLWDGSTSGPPIPESVQAAERPETGDPLQAAIPEDEIAEALPPATEAATPEPDRQVLQPDPERGDGPAVIRGRVVDGQGLPLAGVDVRLRGFQRFTLDAAQRAAAGQESFEEPEGVVTEGDGAFFFVFDVPEQLSLRLNLIKSGHATLTGTWETIQPGQTVELGDLVLGPAVTVTVQVTDTDEVARTGVQVTLAREEGSLDEVEGEFRHRNSFSRSTEEDGSLTYREGVPVGSWRVSARPGTILRPRHVEVLPYPETQVVRLVMESEMSLPTLRGVVTDAEGEPVARAYVFPMNGGSTAVTQADGSFTVKKADQATGDEVRLRVDHPEFEATADLGPFGWGQSDLKISLRRGVEIRLGARHGGKVVGDFTWHLLPLPGTNRLAVFPRSHDGEVTAAEDAVPIPPLSQGSYLLHLRVPGDSLGMARVEEITVSDASKEVWIDVLPTVSRQLRVEEDGEPAEGVAIRLLEPLGSVIDRDTLILEPANSIGQRDNAALAIQEGVTDADGVFLLRSASTAKLGLHLSAPGFEPETLYPVDLSKPEPLVVRLNEGARIRGVILPLELLSDLRRYSFDQMRARGSGLELQLDRRDPSGRWRGQPERNSAGIEADGGFVTGALEPGDYRLSIRWLRPFGGMEGAIAVEAVEIAEVLGLRSGEDRDLGSLYLEHLRRGELRGTVLLNGEPARGSLSLSPEAGGRAETAALGLGGEYRMPSSRAPTGPP